jgi:hypothetical protein
MAPELDETVATNDSPSPRSYGERVGVRGSHEVWSLRALTRR